MRRSLALLLAVLMLCGATITGQTQIHGVFMLGEQAVGDSFVTLAESTTFGPSGTIFDYASRIAAPNYIAPPPDVSTYSTQHTDLRDDECSTDDTTWEAVKTALGSTEDDVAIWLPDDCRVRAFVTASNGGGNAAEYTFASTRDKVRLHCANRTTCGIDIVYRSPATPNASLFETDWESGSTPAFGREPRGALFRVGQGQTSALQSCDITATDHTLGRKRLQLDCSVATDTANEWGPGDIVRIETNRISGFGSQTPTWLTRITCVRNASNVQFPSEDTSGTLCNELTGANQIQLEDQPPFNLHPNAYYWGGAGIGLSFSPHNSEGEDDSGTYAATSGQVVRQLERMGSTRCGIVYPGVCGNGTATNVLAEDITFTNITWGFDAEWIGGSYIKWHGIFGGGMYANTIEDSTGGPGAIDFGGYSSGNNEAGRISIHSLDMHGTGNNTKVFGEILNISRSDPVVIRVAVIDGGGSPYTWGEPVAAFTKDTPEPELAGKLFVKGSATYTDSGTNDYVEFSLEGIDSTGWTGSTSGGIASNIDRYGGASMYSNMHSSNIQVVNSVFTAPLQHWIWQGCAGCVALHNFVYSDPSEGVRGRGGPFKHGNAGASGGIMEGNIMDHPFLPMDSSNGEPERHAEGTNHVWYQNQHYDSGALTWPDGDGPASGSNGDYVSTRGAGITLIATGQNGASNEDWSMFLNSAPVMWTNRLDDVNNDGSTCTVPSSSCDHADGDTAVAPYILYGLAAHHNRCAGSGCNLDTAFDSRNPTTVTDVDDDEIGDGSNAGQPTVPGGWSSYIGAEPDSVILKSVPEYWCSAAGEIGQLGAYYADYTGTLPKNPAQIRFESGLGSCPLVN